MIFYAKLHRARRGYWTELPDFASPGSCGRTLAEVRRRTAAALAALVSVRLARSLEVPEPRRRRGRNWLEIHLSIELVVPLALRRLAREHGLKPAELATMLQRLL